MLHDPDAFARVSRKMRAPLRRREVVIVPGPAELARRIEAAIAAGAARARR